MNDRPDRTSATTEKILRAARELVTKDGAAALTIRRVANEAGVSPSLVIRYFVSRGQLLAEVFAEQRAVYASRLAEAAKDGGAARDRLRAVLELMFKRDIEDPGFTRGFMGAAWSTSPDEVQRMNREVSRDVKTVSAAVADEAASDADRVAASRTLMAVYLQALAETLTDDGDASDGLMRLEAQMDLILKALSTVS